MEIREVCITLPLNDVVELERTGDYLCSSERNALREGRVKYLAIDYTSTGGARIFGFTSLPVLREIGGGYYTWDLSDLTLTRANECSVGALFTVKGDYSDEWSNVLLEYSKCLIKVEWS